MASSYSYPAGGSSPQAAVEVRAPRETRTTGGAPRLEVAIADDCPLIVHGLRAMLEPRGHRVRAVTSAPVAQGFALADTTLFDPARRATDGWGALHALLADRAHGPVVVYSFDPEPPLLVEALAMGCAGFVNKRSSAAELVDTLTSIAVAARTTAQELKGVQDHGRGSSWPGQEHGLSPRESEMLRLITAGLTNEDISQCAALSINTVKTYIRAAYLKMGVSRRSQAVKWGLEHGMLPDVGGES